MPTTTSLLAFVAQGLRVAASFNSPILPLLKEFALPPSILASKVVRPFSIGLFII